jgi:hypothetical protein
MTDRPFAEWDLEQAIERWLFLDRVSAGPITSSLQQLRAAAYPSGWDDMDVLTDLYDRSASFLHAHPPAPRWARHAKMLRAALEHYLEHDGPWQAHLRQRRDRQQQKRAAAAFERDLAQALLDADKDGRTDSASLPALADLAELSDLELRIRLFEQALRRDPRQEMKPAVQAINTEHAELLKDRPGVLGVSDRTLFNARREASLHLHRERSD